MITVARKKEKDFKYYRKDIVKKMGAVGTYNKSFDHIIDVYSNMLLEYNQMLEKFTLNGSEYTIKYTNKSGATNYIKSPEYLIIEKLRVDIISYSRELGLSPSGLKKIKDDTADKKVSRLAEALKDV